MTWEETLAQKGQAFVMRGGPHDGTVFRLYDQPYPKGGSGWDSLPNPDGEYRRPADVDPLMHRKGKPNANLTNIPFMEWHPND